MTGPYIDHIGIIVENMDQSIALFEQLFGVRPVSVKEMHDVGLRIAQFRAENVDIELIQYTTKGEGFAREVMGSKPGINHIAILANDVETSAVNFEDKGAKLMQGFPRRGSHGKVAFFEPESTQGILLEICEHAQRNWRRSP
ncbi:MAG: VOC family protein [Desulfomonile tiedjei]|uniref:VOC family protein n=1 Tax=Desulfomonile tiedjei TaxID=2358 RepID=A0A9D6V171_9BACT|nr:VOC family protein [Desulfomonile tiedjei]